jgi:uncharacterized membrane protein
VWFIIWPIQKVVIASAEQVAKGGQAFPRQPRRGAVAGMASRTNFVLSIPMLFYMGAASHLPNLISPTNSPLVWWVVSPVLRRRHAVNAVKGNEKTRKAAGPP